MLQIIYRASFQLFGEEKINTLELRSQFAIELLIHQSLTDCILDELKDLIPHIDIASVKIHEVKSLEDFNGAR